MFDPNAYKQYMSPYQTEVIDATQQLLNEQRASGRSQLAANAIQQGLMVVVDQELLKLNMRDKEMYLMQHY